VTVAYVLFKIAKVQKDLHRLALQMLKEDKGDGVRGTNWMDKHGDLLREMVDDARMHSDIEIQDEDAIRKTAGDE